MKTTKGCYDFECVCCEHVLNCEGKLEADKACINFVERDGIAKLEEYRQRVYGNKKNK